ncbi:hypothetical protein EYB25_005740 [Talaromyces marneffei]|nr:hypothetical protein EYB25_005740 [Talaromyces marneffei]
MNAFMSNGVLTGPVQSKLSMLCTGTSTGPSALWSKFGWSAQVFEVDPTALNGFKGAVDDTGAAILIQDVIPRDTKALPWLLTPKMYYNVESAEYGTDLCVAPEGSKALAITMQGASKETHNVRSKTVELAETEPIVLFCPGLFDATTKMLSNVVGEEPQPYFGIQISTVIAEVSLTKDSNGKVIKTFTSFDSTTNAQTYEYFIFAWWYYKQTWTYVRNTETITAPAATFYDGILVPWNDPES